MLLPEPLGPISACTSPCRTFRFTPRKISLPLMATCRFSIERTLVISLSSCCTPVLSWPEKSRPQTVTFAKKAGLRLEVAESVAVEPALTELAGLDPALSRTSSARGADRSIGLGQLIVRARMLAQERDRPSRLLGNFGLDPPVEQQVGELHKPPFPFLAADLRSIHLGHPLGHPDEQVPAQLAVRRSCPSARPRVQPPGRRSSGQAASAPARSPRTYAAVARAPGVPTSAQPAPSPATAPADCESPCPSHPGATHLHDR